MSNDCNFPETKDEFYRDVFLITPLYVLETVVVVVASVFKVQFGCFIERLNGTSFTRFLSHLVASTAMIMSSKFVSTTDRSR